jgi:spore coat polysaccharide biosynthesis protein SpsF (cytidylyltransferase family)
MALSEFEIKRIEKVVGAYIEKHRPPVHIRNELDLSFRVEGQNVEIFEIRPSWQNPDAKLESEVAKATYVKSKKIWKVYWMRADLKWHRYDPAPEVKSIEDFIKVVEQDEYGCFFG